MCKIDYETYTITIAFERDKYIGPLITKPQTQDGYRIPPTSKIILPIKLNIKDERVDQRCVFGELHRPIKRYFPLQNHKCE